MPTTTPSGGLFSAVLGLLGPGSGLTAVLGPALKLLTDHIESQAAEIAALKQTLAAYAPQITPVQLPPTPGFTSTPNT